MANLFNSSLGIAGLVLVVLVIIYFMSPKPKSIEDEGKNNREEQIAVSKETSVAKQESNKLETDMELVAAITGALSAYLDMPASKLKIKSIKRSDGNSSAWRTVALRS
jgi:hypothetical protein